MSSITQPLQLKEHLDTPKKWWRFENVNTRLVVSGTIIGLYIIATLIGPYLVEYGPLDQSLARSLQPPNYNHLLGTDELGRDMLSRLLSGGRVSLMIMIVSITPTCILGSLVGVIAGYKGGLLDYLIMRFIDAMMSFPGLLLGLLVVSFLGPGTRNLIIALIIYLFPSFIRISRSAVMGIRDKEYITAALAIGAGTSGIIRRHLLPNVLTPIVIQLTILMGSTLLITSSLSFLGLGVARPDPEWGLMLADGRQYLRNAPHIAFVPGVTLTLLLLSLNMLGDALRDVLDPQDDHN